MEVMVALAIVAIALAAIIKTSGDGAANAAYLRDKTLAHWVAMNKITELHVQRSWPSVEITRGTAFMGPAEWHWTMRVSETEDKDVRRVVVEVRHEQANRKEVLARLVGFVGRPPSTTPP
jgi:general secretion pathway protein I